MTSGRQHSRKLLFDEQAARDDVGQRCHLWGVDRTQFACAQKLCLAGNDRQISPQVVHGHGKMGGPYIAFACELTD